MSAWISGPNHTPLSISVPYESPFGILWPLAKILYTCREQAFHVLLGVAGLDPDSKPVRRMDWGNGGLRTRALHWTPLALTASITASTFFSRARAFAFRVTDNFHGVFLAQCQTTSNETVELTPPEQTREVHMGRSKRAQHGQG